MYMDKYLTFNKISIMDHFSKGQLIIVILLLHK